MTISRTEPASSPTNSPAKLAYSIPEAVAASGIGRSSLYDDIGAGRLIARKRGGRTIILVADLAAYLTGLPPMPCLIAPAKDD
jgi:hypothetical protein